MKIDSDKLYYNKQDPPIWNPDPKDLPEGCGAVLLMRHSIRPPMIAGKFGTQIELTSEGIAKALNVGKRWGNRILGVSCSSSFRCIQTGEKIIEGSGLELSPLHNPTLGEPGAYINNFQEAIAFMEENDPLELVKKMLQNILVPGHVPSKEGTNAIILSILANNPPEGKISIKITHDTILACLLYQLQGRTSINQHDWPKMLEGVLLWKEEKKIYWKWRGEIGSKTYSF
jgi:phosphohistidine phosphatase SixA